MPGKVGYASDDAASPVLDDLLGLIFEDEACELQISFVFGREARTDLEVIQLLERHR